MADMFINSGPSSSSSFSSSRSAWTYDVFLSFRGEDTRRSFTDHLYTALVQAGIHTFRDDDELPRGQEISPRLQDAIQQSKISIVVFSKGYAYSTWCLNELVKIMECRCASGQVVLPVFYDIDPSCVRNQERSFAEALGRHEERFKEEIEKVNKWKKALAEASNLSGWNLQSMANGYESKFIQMIVEDVLDKLDRKYLHVAKHPVGISSRVRKLHHLLSIDTDDNVHVVGIHGMGGVGKTTIAKALFNELRDGFEGSCFLLNVKDISKESNGWVQLQGQLLYDILRTRDLKISNVDRGINLIKERFCKKRILVVIDDVDEQEQLDRLIGERSWVGSRSVIIITTRDEHLLTQFGVDVKCKVKTLNKVKSLHLFRRYAFKDTNQGEEYDALLNEIVDYCGGLPLALKVLGSHLYKRSKTEWDGEIKKLQNSPDGRIQKILRTSFVGLDDYTKGIFLDIACFFVGWNRDYIVAILDGRGFIPERGIAILIQRSLLFDCGGILYMHDLIRDVGREIVREVSPNRPGERSRIWRHEDAWNVLEKQMGTDQVEGLMLDLPRESEIESLTTEALKEMRYLKLLKVNGLRLIGCYGHLSKELIWFYWHKCHLASLPSDLEIHNLSVLDMQNGNIKELWKGTKVLNKLKILNLSYSKHLVVTPNFYSSSLEKLILEGCSSLTTIHQSIVHLKSLVFLNLKGCCRLKNLPENMRCLNSLETLDVTGCSNLEKLPECLGDMESLTELLANETTIKKLPSSIENLKKLRKLLVSKFNYNLDSLSTSWLLPMISRWVLGRHSNSSAFLLPSFAGFSSLREIDLSYHGLSEDVISSVDFGSLSCLNYLNLEGNKFFNLPSGVGCLPKLWTFRLGNCKNLLSISELPSSLASLRVENCTSLERISVDPSKTRRELALLSSGCIKLTEIQGLEHLRWKDMRNCANLANSCRETLVQGFREGKSGMIVFPGDEIPDWFSHSGDTYCSRVSFYVPAASEGEIQALLFWVVLEPQQLKQQKGHCRPTFEHSTNAYLAGRKKSSGTCVFRQIYSIPHDDLSMNHSLVISECKLHNVTNSHDNVTVGEECSQKGGEECELSVHVGYKDDIGLPNIVIKRVGVHLVVKT